MTATAILLLLAMISFLLAAFAVTVKVGANGSAFSFRDLGFALVVAAFLTPMLP